MSGKKRSSSNDGGQSKVASKKGKTANLQKKKRGKGKQLSLLATGTVKIKSAAFLVDELILLTDKIYGTKIPEHHKGHLFLYQVNKYDGESKSFSVRYQNRMVKEDGVNWIDQNADDEHGEREVIDGVKLKPIEEGVELYRKALGRVNAHHRDGKLVQQAALDDADTTPLLPGDVIMTNLDEASCIDPIKGWQSQHVLDVDFRETGRKGTTISGLDKREWISRHCGFMFWQQKNRGNKTWNTGVWNKKLLTLSNGNVKEAIGNVLVVTRAKYMLFRRENGGPNVKLSKPGKGMGFYTFEEDLHHHINEAISIISSGSPLSFYNDPFVKAMLNGLNPLHRPVYRNKLAKIIRCVNDVLQKEIWQMITESSLTFNNSFVASTSDFWWDPVKKKSFGGSVGNFMANHYYMSNGLYLAISNKTMSQIIATNEGNELLRSTSPITDRVQALLDFGCFTQLKTGQNIGEWLQDIHQGAGILPEYIGSHTVDGASNAGASVETLEWQTSGERSQKIIADACDAHKINTTAGQASGTSAHVTNQNPELGKSLNKLHDWFSRICRKPQRQKVLRKVQQEHLREEWATITPAVVTRWDTRHKEALIANVNQHDIDTAIRRMVAPGGVDAAKYLEYTKGDNMHELLIEPDDWALYLQFESGIQPLKDYSKFAQSAKVIVHLELFEARRALQRLKSHFFEMYENISKKTGLRLAKDLTLRIKNQLVTADRFILEGNEFSTKYDNFKEHAMLPLIVIARRLAFRHLGIRLGFFKRVNTLDGMTKEELDIDISQGTFAGLEDAFHVSDMKIMGALINPLLQCDDRMVEAGLCTRRQVEAGYSQLIDRLTRYYESVSDHAIVHVPVVMGKTNKWSKVANHKSNDTPHALAVSEFEKFEKYNDCKYLPQMSPLKVLGDLDINNQLQEPVYAMGPVMVKGENLPGKGKRNHADYVDRKGYYDIVKYLTHHRDIFPALYSVGVGQLCPHISTEVDCESLFSQAGFLSSPRRANTSIRMYERLVVGKHRLFRIHCSLPKVHELFIERWRKDDWNENDDRDDREFLSVERKIYKEMYPHGTRMLEEEEAEEETEEEEELEAEEKEKEEAGKGKGKEKEKEKEKRTRKVKKGNKLEEIVIDDSSDDSGYGTSDNTEGDTVDNSHVSDNS